jgi:hypothetical protein
VKEYERLLLLLLHLFECGEKGWWMTDENERQVRENETTNG